MAQVSFVFTPDGENAPIRNYRCIPTSTLADERNQYLTGKSAVISEVGTHWWLFIWDVIVHSAYGEQRLVNTVF